MPRSLKFVTNDATFVVSTADIALTTFVILFTAATPSPMLAGVTPFIRLPKLFIPLPNTGSIPLNEDTPDISVATILSATIDSCVNAFAVSLILIPSTSLTLFEYLARLFPKDCNCSPKSSKSLSPAINPHSPPVVGISLDNATNKFPAFTAASTAPASILSFTADANPANPLPTLGNLLANSSISLSPAIQDHKPPLLGIESDNVTSKFPAFTAASTAPASILSFTFSENLTNPSARGSNLLANSSISLSPAIQDHKPPLLGMDDAISVSNLPALAAASIEAESILPLIVSENFTKASPILTI